VTAPGTAKLSTDMMTSTGFRQTKPSELCVHGGCPKPDIKLDWDLGFPAASALPSGLAQTFEHVGVVFPTTSQVCCA
jgi:hypothetical protein